MYDLKDKVVLVTGASKGIGATFVRQILEEGVQHVRILDVDVGSGELLQNELNEKYGENKVKFVKCDVTNDDQFYKALEDAKEDNGYIDLLVNNAGVADESKIPLIRRLMEINFIALVNGTLKAIELMSKKNGGRGGAVINISSIGGLLQVSPMFIYSTTKRAVLHFSRCVGQLPCENTGVRVLAICVGVTETEILGKIKYFSKRLDEGTQEVLGHHPVQRVIVATEMEPEIQLKLLTTIKEALSSKNRQDGVALPIFDPATTDSGVVAWCADNDKLGEKFGWSDLTKVAKGGKAPKGSALIWYES